MDSVSFQNGFVCGIATKGLVKSGAVYEPEAYNDAGVYDFFYLDFKRVMEPFSIGQFNDSVIVSGAAVLPVTDVEQYSDTVYKVFCNISNQSKGVSVSNKKTTRLHFWDGTQVPVFSEWFSVAGLASILDAGYFYEKAQIDEVIMTATENSNLVMWTPIVIPPISETANITGPDLTATENVNIVLK